MKLLRAPTSTPAFHEVRVWESNEPADDIYGLFSDLEVQFLPQDSEPAESVVDPDYDSDELDLNEDPSYVASLSLKDLEPITILYILQDTFKDDEWWEYPTSMVIDILDDELDLETGDSDIIQALHILLYDETFWTVWEVFNWITEALGGRLVSQEHVARLTPERICRSIDVGNIALQIRGQQADFSNELAIYVALCCLDKNLWFLPDPLAFAQESVFAILHRRGWPTPPLAGVVEAIEKGIVEEPSTEVEFQAIYVEGLKELRQDRFKKAKREIQAYRKHKKAT